MGLVQRDAALAPRPNAGLLLASYLAGAFPTAELVTRARRARRPPRGIRQPRRHQHLPHRGPGRGGGAGRASTWPKGRSRPCARPPVGGTARSGPACGVAAVLGHCFPPTDPPGGKGVATTGGMLLALDPPLALLVPAGWGLPGQDAPAGPAWPRSQWPPPSRWRRSAWRGPARERLALAAVAAIIVVRHRDNIARLRAGQEGLSARTTGPNSRTCG